MRLFFPYSNKVNKRYNRIENYGLNFLFLDLMKTMKNDY